MPVYFNCNKCGGTFDPAFTYCPVCDPDGGELEALRKQVSEQQQEIDRLKAENNSSFTEGHNSGLSYHEGTVAELTRQRDEAMKDAERYRTFLSVSALTEIDNPAVHELFDNMPEAPSKDDFNSMFDQIAAIQGETK